MYVGHIRNVSEDVFISFDDKTKIRMITNQLFFLITPDDDHNYRDVFAWICENALNPFYIKKEDHDKNVKAWVYFYDVDDLIAFKLRWM